MINLITYNIPHRKTQDVIRELLFRGYNKIRLIIIPFEDKKTFKPIYIHRPSACINATPYELAKRLNLEAVEYSKSMKFVHPTLIGGAGILPQTGLINSHPGYLPNVRGLDALKWAIYEEQPIGVTTHITSEEPDSGVLIENCFIPIYYEDSFYELAMRVYETEIKMLVDAIEIPVGEKILNEYYKPHRRMPHNKEIKMMEIFNQLRLISPNKN